MIRVGCSGWPARHAAIYAALGAVEVQQTFYEPPKAQTLAKWRAEAPPSFRFAVKCFQVVTHDAGSPTYRRLKRRLVRPEAVGSFRDTPEVRAAWKETVDSARALGADVVLVQTPSAFVPTATHLDRLRAFLSTAVAQVPVLAFEPRGSEWDPGAADDLCAEHAVLRACDPFVTEPPSPSRQGVAYFRMHGGGNYGHAFTEPELARLASIAARYRDAWVFFNNVSMWEDARRLLRILSRG